MNYKELENLLIDLSYEVARIGEKCTVYPIQLSYSEFVSTVTNLVELPYPWLSDPVALSNTFCATIQNGIRFILIADIPRNETHAVPKEFYLNRPIGKVSVAYNDY